MAEIPKSSSTSQLRNTSGVLQFEGLPLSDEILRIEKVSCISMSKPTRACIVFLLSRISLVFCEYDTQEAAKQIHLVSQNMKMKSKYGAHTVILALQ